MQAEMIRFKDKMHQTTEENEKTSIRIVKEVKESDLSEEEAIELLDQKFHEAKKENNEKSDKHFDSLRDRVKKQIRNGSIVGNLKQKVMECMNKVSEFMSKLFAQLVQIYNKVVEFIQETFRKIAKFLHEAWEKVKVVFFPESHCIKTMPNMYLGKDLLFNNKFGILKSDIKENAPEKDEDDFTTHSVSMMFFVA